MTDDFSTARPGQKLWSLRFGEVVFCRTAVDGDIVCNKGQANEFWRKDGTTNLCSVQDLYWAKPQIIAPPRPIEMMEKEWVVWLNLYPDGSVGWHRSQERADRYAHKDRVGPAERVIIKRMVPKED